MTFATLRYALRHPVARAEAIAVVSLAAVLGAILIFHWNPAVDQQRQLADRLSAARRGLVDAHVQQELKTAYDQASVKMTQIERKLRTSASPAELVKAYAQLARASGVRMRAESYEEEAEQGSHSVTVAHLELQGRYPKLRRYIAGLSGLPLWVDVVEASFDRTRIGDAEIRLQLRVVARRRLGDGGST